MKYTLKKLYVFILGFVMLTCFAFVMFNGVSKKVSAQAEIIATTDLFTIAELDVTCSVIASESDSLQPGVMLTADKKGDSILLRNKLSGEFSFNFEPITVNKVVTTKIFDTTFTSETGDSFTIRINYGDIKTSASIIANGKEFGIAYNEYRGSAEGNTSYANSQSVFTTIPTSGETFVSFNPETMQIKAGKEGREILIWDLDEQVNDKSDIGVIINDFYNYTVKFEIVDFKGDSSSILIRKINDCYVDALVLENSGTPNIYVDFSENAVKGRKYTLPKGIATDLFDGELDLVCQIETPYGLLKSTASEVVFGEAGNYNIIYSATNNRGVTATKKIVLTVFDKQPDYDYELTDGLLSENHTLDMCVGDSLFVQKMILTGGLYLNGSKTANVTVKYKGVAINGYTSVKSGLYYKFTKSGVYEFVYEVGNEKTVSCFVNVIDSESSISANISDLYNFGEIIDVRNAKIITNNKTVDCSITVEYPDGSVYANNFFECNQVGEYVLYAEAEINGENYACSKTFSVAKLTKEVFTYNKNSISSSYGKDSYTNVEGVMLKFSGGESATYSNLIDLKQYENQAVEDKDGFVVVSENAIPLASVSIDPAGYGEHAAEEFYVELTDENDPNNVLSVVISRTDMKTWSFVRARAGDQTHVGFNNATNGKTKFHSQMGDFHSNGRYGYQQVLSFNGDFTYFSPDKQIITLYYDNVEKQILVRPHDAQFKNCVVCDFDDPMCVVGTTWQGFSSDKAYLSIRPGRMIGDSCTIAVYEAGGVKFDSEFFTYEKAPEISVNKSTMTGVVGKNIKVPTATAIDQFGASVEVVSKAYYCVDAKRYDVKIKDGRFLANKTGKYQIVYYAKDIFGNTSEKIVNVEVQSRANDITMSFNNNPSSNYTNGKTGYKIPVYTNVNVSNSIGDITLTWRVEGDGNVELLSDGFIPNSAGDYTVYVTVTDELDRSVDQSYTVDVELEANPVSSIKPVYYGFIRGNVYELMDVYAIDYSQGSEAVKAEIYINGVKTDKNVFTSEKIIEEKDAPETKEIVKIEYKVNGKTVCCNGEALSYEVPLIAVYKKDTIKLGMVERNVTNFMISRYFLLNNDASILAAGNYYSFVTSKQNNATIQFVQPLSSSDLNFVFDINDIKNSDFKPISDITLSYVKFVITDSNDASKQIVIEFRYENFSTNLYVNNVAMQSVSAFKGLFSGEFKSNVNISFDRTNYALLESNEGVKIAQLSEYLNGEKFDGFSDKVYLSFEVGAREGKTAGIKLMSINGQILPTSRIDEDNYTPSIVLNEKCGGMYAVGENAIIPAASAYDVFSDVPDNSLLVSVLYNGQPVRDVNGVTLENVTARTAYTIKLDWAGNYVISYTAKDSRKGQTSREFLITARISQEPIIEAVEIVSSVKLGDKIKIPTTKVTFAEDNAENKLFIVYVAPDNTYQWFEGGEITASMKGTYRIRYMALDAYGNLAYKEYKVVCG